MMGLLTGLVPSRSITSPLLTVHIGSSHTRVAKVVYRDSVAFCKNKCLLTHCHVTI